MDPQNQRQVVSKYYGETLKSSNDLRTSACCPIESIPSSHQHILSKLHPEVVSKFYGCGSPIPSYLRGAKVLDLGCGTGRDAYLTSALVGPTGSVVGVDMTDAQLNVAKQYQKYHSQLFFGDPNLSNVDFRKGYIEDLSAVNIVDNSVDVVISNCVCNLSPDKSKVFSEVYRVLKQGGEFYFSDVYADRRLSEEASKNPILVGECLGGALYLEDFRRLMRDAGFMDPRVVSSAPVSLTDTSLKSLVSDVNFYSVTFRAFKVSDLEDGRENYLQTAIYEPSPLHSNSEPVFKLDIDNIFEANVPCAVDSNTASILNVSRFKDLFNITDPTSHKGLFYQSKNTTSHSYSLDSFRPGRLPTLTTNVHKTGMCSTKNDSINPASSEERATQHGCKKSGTPDNPVSSDAEPDQRSSQKTRSCCSNGC